jgi:hypothetical protein
MSKTIFIDGNGAEHVTGSSRGIYTDRSPKYAVFNVPAITINNSSGSNQIFLIGAKTSGDLGITSSGGKVIIPETGEYIFKWITGSISASFGDIGIYLRIIGNSILGHADNSRYNTAGWQVPAMVEGVGHCVEQEQILLTINEGSVPSTSITIGPGTLYICQNKIQVPQMVADGSAVISNPAPGGVVIAQDGLLSAAKTAYNTVQAASITGASSASCTYADFGNYIALITAFTNTAAAVEMTFNININGKSVMTNIPIPLTTSTSSAIGYGTFIGGNVFSFRVSGLPANGAWRSNQLVPFWFSS